MLIPYIREDLRLIPLWKDGSKEWYIHDPLRNKYHSVNRDTLLLIKHWRGGESLKNFFEFLKDQKIDIALEDLLNFIYFLKKNKLIKAKNFEDIRSLNDEKKASAGLKRYSKAYIFYRLHLVNPDTWLGKNIRYASFIASKYIRYPIYGLFAFGLFNFFNGNISYSDNTNYLFSFEGIILLIISIIFLKICHELAHAFTLKYFDGSVPSMGVSLIFLFPLLFTDANSSWELGKRQRLLVGSAGMLAEFHIGMLAFFVWSINDPGILNNLSFALFVAAFVSSVIINATPFLKFDGYFLLCDWINFDNLHERSFAVAKTKLKNFFLSSKEVIPDSLSQRQEKNLFLFALATWAYRLFIFTTISMVVYAFFPFKILGLIASFVLLYLLLLLPVLKELINYFHYIAAQKGFINHLKASYKPSLVLIVFLGIIFLPFKTNYQAYGVLTSEEYRALFPGSPALIKDLLFTKDLSVTRDQKIINLISPEDMLNLEKLKEQKKIAEGRIKILRISQSDLDEINLLQTRLNEILRNIEAIEGRITRNEIHSPIDGRLVNSYLLSVNSWVGGDRPLVNVVNNKQLQVIGFIKENELSKLKDSRSLIFVSNDLHLQPIRVSLASYDSLPVKSLNDYPQLSSIYGGRIPSHLSKEEQGLIQPNAPLIKVHFELQDDTNLIPEMETKGVIHIKSETGISLASRITKAIFSRIQGLV